VAGKRRSLAIIADNDDMFVASHRQCSPDKNTFLLSSPRDQPTKSWSSSVLADDPVVIDSDADTGAAAEPSVSSLSYAQYSRAKRRSSILPPVNKSPFRREVDRLMKKECSDDVKGDQHQQVAQFDVCVFIA